MSDKPHEHEFVELSLNRIKRVHQGYHGTTGDRAFITKKCACGKVKPVDYGTTKDMLVKYKAWGGGDELRDSS